MKGISYGAKNKYVVDLIDSLTGRTKQHLVCHNTVLTSNFLEQLIGAGGSYNANYPMMGYLHIGTGTGTPSASDTALFTDTGNVSLSYVSHAYGDPTSTFTYKATFGATSSWVGTYTELGIACGSTLWTHALFTDSEGNPITIRKTDTDILVVTVTVYLTITYQSGWDKVVGVSTRHGNIRMRERSLYVLVAMCQARFYSSVSYTPYYGSIDNVYNTVDAAGLSSSGNRRYINTRRLGSDAGPRGFVNSIYFSKHGFVTLPNADYFPPYTVQDIDVALGDGVTTSFICPLPVFTEGTDVVKIDGVVQTRGVAYTLDHDGNSQLDPTAAASAMVRTLSGGVTHEVSGTISVYTPGVPQYGGKYITYSSPLIYEFDEPVAVNTLFADWWYRNNSSAAALEMILEYSSDKVNWTVATTITTRCASSKANVGTAYQDKKYTFPEVTAQYWRLRIGSGSASAVQSDTTGIAAGIGTFFGHTGQGLIFANPPAQDAPITITAQLDRPYNMNGVVIDWSASFYYE